MPRHASEDDITPFSLDYEVFCDRLDDYGGETPLDEESYENVRKQEGISGIVSAYEFQEENDRSIQQHYGFDAVREEYIR